MGDLYKEAIPKRGDCKRNLKNYNGNKNSSDFHQVLNMLQSLCPRGSSDLTSEGDDWIDSPWSVEDSLQDVASCFL